jgi:CxxC-x17-CxxC domain-containing protein
MYDDRRSGGGHRDRPPREMYDATCSDCGQVTQVPFKPDPDRPVFCRDCYRKRRPPRY